MRQRATVASFLLLLVLRGDADGLPELPETWGPGNGYSTGAGYELLENDADTQLVRSAHDGTYCSSSGPGPHDALARIEVPDGAILTHFRFWAFDSHTDDDLLYSIIETCQPLGDTSPTTRSMGQANTISDIGPFSSFTPLDNTTANNRDCFYTVFVRFVGTGVPCRGAQLATLKHQIIWRRQVSPAPAAAAFEDVPTTHPFFRFIEALRASGITGGCQASPPLYCPNAPITRGEMAVFLSAALGLHWPN